MTEWSEDLEYDLRHRWSEQMDAGLNPDRLLAGLTRALGKDLKPKLVHAVESDDQAVAFLLVRDDETFLIRFDPPNDTTIRFLGSLAGGRYVEAVHVETGWDEVEGVFKHERLGDQPLRVTVRWVKNRAVRRSEGEARADERSEQLRKMFRRWAAEPPRRSQ